MLGVNHMNTATFLNCRSAILDFSQALNNYLLACMLGWQDVKLRYRRSVLGAFWITISMGILIATIGVVFSQIFKSPIEDYLPFLAIGIIFWNFLSSVITEGCFSFIAAEAMIKQLPVPLFVHVLRVVWRNIIILCHNLVILPVLFFFLSKPVDVSILLFIPGFCLVLFNLIWMALILGLICTRYRDFPQIVTSLLQIVFYLTPVIWLPSALPQHTRFYLLDLNPVYYMLEVIRGPLLGELPSVATWVMLLGMAGIGWVVAVILFGHAKKRLAYWL